MKKVFATIIATFILHTCFAQGDYQKKLDSISNVVIRYFQAKQADSIYALAGSAFKSQLSQEKFKSISESQIFPLNDFKNIAFVKTANGINKYKVAGSPELQLLISLDKEDKLETLLLQPFVDD